MATQSCPNCQRQHDVGVYVTGQKVLCVCGIRFEVRRTDVTSAGRPTLNQRASRAEPELALAVGGASAVHVAGGLDATVRPPSNVVRPNGISIAVGLDEEAAAEDADSRPDAAAVNGESHAAVVEHTMISRPPVEIPGYELQVLLGRGGMGEVWQAVQKSLGRTVAIKLLPPDLARDTEFVVRFEKEATALAALSHPHIIQIIDRGAHGQHYYFVMEFVQGRSLRQLITAAAPTPDDTLRIILQILSAMECAHEKEIIHRDLKPENILLDARGHAKVADFGLAGMRAGEERHQLTATAVAMGTLNYMAPEQRRDARNVDARADLYSVGVILYELLTGELPIGRFRMPSERIVGLDPRFDDVVGKLLESDRDHRFFTAREVISQLEPLQSTSQAGTGAVAVRMKTASHSAPSTQVTTTPQSFVQRGVKGLRNGLVVIGALALIAFGTRLFWSGEDAPRLTLSGGGSAITLTPEGVQQQKSQQEKLPFAGNAYEDLYASVVEKPLPEGRLSLALSFDEGEEKFNAHSGEWALQNGTLHVLQAGNETDGERLVPRGYVGRRYFSADDFDAQVAVTYKDVRDRYRVADDAQRFAELAFRIKNLQVSAFAIPGVGMRLGWRYFTDDGTEVSGNSARDVEMMVNDEMPAPADGKPYRMRLRLQRRKDAVKVTAYLNDKEFASKVLPGLQEQVGKIAVGCRNYECTFDDLVVQGKAADRPTLRVADGDRE